MKKIIGVILIIVGVICLPQVITVSVYETIGGIIGVSLFSFIPSYFLLRSKNGDTKDNQVISKSNTGLSDNLLKKQSPTAKNVNADLMGIMRNIAESNSANYWNGFTTRKPQEAKEIEYLLSKDMSKVSDIEAFEITTTLLRWAANFNNCRIKDLKKNIIEGTYECLEKESDIDVAIELAYTKIDEEAKAYNISKEHTATYFMHKWLIEARDERLLEKQNSDFNSINNSLTDDILEIIANSKGEENTNDNFTCYLAAKQNPQESLAQIKLRIRNSFEEDIKQVIKEYMDDSLMLDLMCKASIAAGIESCKESYSLQLLSGLNKEDFEKLVDEIAIEAMNKYFE